MTADEDRGQWGNQLEFILACVGYAVGLGNVWRFPYLAYENGGATFLIPYFISLLIAGLPIFYLEMTLGQFSSLGPNQVFRKLAPIFHGVGWGMISVAFLVVIYYNVVIAWALIFLFYSFRLELPWASCANDWNTFRCTSNLEQEKCGESLNVTYADAVFFNKTCYNATFFNATIWPVVKPTIWNDGNYTKVSASEEFFNRHVLGLNFNETTGEQLGFGDMGTFKWDITLCLFIAWVIVFVCLAKGVQSVGKVVYFTATFPYLVLLILMIRGVTLEGAGLGLKFYLEPNLEKLIDIKVWRAAATQIFYSLGPGFGTLLTMASYNRFNNNCYSNAIIVAFINCGTSFFAGIAIFSVMGFMATNQGSEVSDVVKSGPGLTFIAYPEAIVRMPVAPLFSIMFFFMILLLGIDSQFAMVETVTTGILDEWRWTRKYKTVVVGLTCLALFICGLPMTLNGGFYIFELLNVYAASYSLMIIAFIEFITVAWLYGMDNFCRDLNMMMGAPNTMLGRIFGNTGLYWKITWTFIGPVYMVALLVMSFVFYKPTALGGYAYPTGAEAAGWCIVAIPVLLIVVFAVYHVVTDVFVRKLPWSALWNPTDKWCPAIERERMKQLRNNATAMNAVPPTNGDMKQMHTNPAFDNGKSDKF